MWDTAGQEKYHSLAALYYRGFIFYPRCTSGNHRL
ncbi:MAG: hypothetical protein ACK56F_17165 [bacterium]